MGALEAESSFAFAGPEAGLPLQALSAESLLPLPTPFWPTVLPFSSIASIFKSGFRRLPRLCEEMKVK